MTKLMEWLSVLSALFAIWFSIVNGYVKIHICEQNMTLVFWSPLIFIALFGVYAVLVIMFRVLTFNDCIDAAKELQEEISEARKDLEKQGLRW